MSEQSVELVLAKSTARLYQLSGTFYIDKPFARQTVVSVDVVKDITRTARQLTRALLHNGHCTVERSMAIDGNGLVDRRTRTSTQPVARPAATSGNYTAFTMAKAAPPFLIFADDRSARGRSQLFFVDPDVCHKNCKRTAKKKRNGQTTRCNQTLRDSTYGFAFADHVQYGERCLAILFLCYCTCRMVFECDR